MKWLSKIFEYFKPRYVERERDWPQTDLDRELIRLGKKYGVEVGDPYPLLDDLPKVYTAMLTELDKKLDEI